MRSPERGDLQQIGVSKFARELFDQKDVGTYFGELGDFIKFAICVAIHSHLEPTRPKDGDSFMTSQESSRWDSNGAIQALIVHYKNTDTPYRLGQELAEAGFRHIKEHIDSGQPIDDLICD